MSGDYIVDALVSSRMGVALAVTNDEMSERWREHLDVTDQWVAERRQSCWTDCQFRRTGYRQAKCSACGLFEELVRHHTEEE